MHLGFLCDSIIIMKKSILNYTTVGDFHMHTQVSQHAYSSVDEMVQEALAKDLKAIAFTNHGPAMPDGAMSHHFFCMDTIPREIGGLQVYKGAEANITTYEGTIDFEASLLDRLDFIIASYHTECIVPSSRKDHTKGYLNVIKNPRVHCLGHCGNPVYAMDHETVVKACADYGKIIEINANSFKIRPGSETTCSNIAELCALYSVPIMINSDAHIKYSVGDHYLAQQLLADIDFPPDLVINTNWARTKAYFDTLMCKG